MLQLLFGLAIGFGHRVLVGFVTAMRLIIPKNNFSTV